MDPRFGIGSGTSTAARAAGRAIPYAGYGSRNYASAQFRSANSSQ